MSYQTIPQLEALKTVLVATANQQLNNTNDLLEKVILSSALMKWNQVSSAIKFPDDNKTIHEIEESNLPFFTGNIPSYFPSFYKHLFTKGKMAFILSLLSCF